MIEHYRRFKDYTFKLSIVCLISAVICLILFNQQRWIAGILFIAGISALGHHAYLKIMLYYYDRKDH